MKASINLAISLDGFIARPDGDVSWLDPYHDDGHEDGGFAEFFESIDCLVMGRKSFEKVLSFDVAWPYGDKRVVVLSRSGVQIPSELENTTEQMTGMPTDVADTLEKRGFAHLYIDGGSTIRGFLDAGLIDNINLTRVPIILGSGISLFDGLKREISLDHIATRSLESGLVQSEYRVANTDARHQE
ncbi:dihydrofolate reductase family protein [Haloferula sp.]|uniref:dihydrofolate reductase family protein n=1 Tax=Haloferula sp. TaxID=2497595 RepID=UPI00329E4AA3